MERFGITPENKLRSPEEELSFLRDRLKELEGRMSDGKAQEATHEERVGHVLESYRKTKPETILEKGHAMLKPEIDAIVLDLAPEEHDTQISELLALLTERGVKNTLSVVEALGDPHVEDDFHRFLAEYLKTGYPAKGIDERGPLWRALHMTLFSISLPFSDTDVREKPLKELISSMEQLYAGLSSVARNESKEGYFAFEVAVENNAEHATMYASVPADAKELFEKQLLSIFPHAHLTECKNDYNIFKEGGAFAGSVATFERFNAYPIKTYDTFDYDPLNVTLSAFAKLAAQGEGAAFQLIVRPVGDTYAKRYGTALEKLRDGGKAKEILEEKTLAKEISKTLKDIFGSKKKKDDTKKEEKKMPDERAVEQVSLKIAYPVVSANLRLIVSAETSARAENVLHDLEAAFNQFESAPGNAFDFVRIKKNATKKFLRDFTFRLFSDDNALPMNLRELATIFHLPSANVDSSRELKRASSTRAPAPVGLPTEGIVLGVNRFRGIETKIHYAPDDRLRHLYVIGQTGTGKTTMLKNMIIQDIKNGEGVCMIDPHGSDIVEVLASVPEERRGDVIYFDPSHTDRPMALNMLEYDVTRPEQKTFVVNELFSIFQKLYGKVPESMGPMFEQYFRNATMLVIEDPETGNTLFDVSRVLSDREYRQLKLSHCKNPVVVQFWREVAEKAGGEGALANIVPYITSKFDVFLANDIMRPIIVQKTSTFDFRQIMDERKILLVNLAKGRLGDINANLLGLIIVGKILMAALSRVDRVGVEDIAPFYLYIDEFQNVTTDSIATILSEARKYKLSLTVAHQFIKQLDERIKDAVFGNVGSLASFRIGSDDAEYLEKQFAPVFSSADLMNMDNRIASLKMLNHGRPERAFSLETLAPERFDRDRASLLMEESFKRYGRPREDVEAELQAIYGESLAP